MKVPIIHQTDLFHPHIDLDDHWDLACQFGLAYMGNIDLKGILIDYPPSPVSGNPSIQSVNQLNFITGLSVPVAVGAAKCEALQGEKPSSGVSMVLKILEESAEPVVIHIVGSCRDIAAAGKLVPELFSKKCKAIYLNAGSSKFQENLEYNVMLDPGSYSSIFDIPCPIYWMPCFEDASIPHKMGEYGTFYTLPMYDILPYLSESMQKFFAFAFGRVMDNRWLSYLSLPIDRSVLDFYRETSDKMWCTEGFVCNGNRLEKEMWCTAGFLHCAGKVVKTNGDITDIKKENTGHVFCFEPVELSCSGDGVVNWRLASQNTQRYIFRILNLESYSSAMVKALKTILVNIK